MIRGVVWAILIIGFLTGCQHVKTCNEVEIFLDEECARLHPEGPKLETKKGPKTILPAPKSPRIKVWKTEKKSLGR